MASSPKSARTFSIASTIVSATYFFISIKHSPPLHFGIQQTLPIRYKIKPEFAGSNVLSFGAYTCELLASIKLPANNSSVPHVQLLAKLILIFVAIHLDLMINNFLALIV